MAMHDEAVDFLFEALRSAVLRGRNAREAFDEAIEDTIEVYFYNEFEEAKKEAAKKKLIDMTDHELAQACKDAQVRLKLADEEMSSRKSNDDGNGGADQ